jgi:hypothetical protein
MNLDDAVSGMTHDTWAVRLVEIHPDAGKEVEFLRDSDWMVILDKGKAVDLILCKGY